eukprot:tig00020848_g14589.t1
MPPKKAATSKGAGKGGKGGKDADDKPVASAPVPQQEQQQEGQSYDWEPPKEYIKPTDQLQLTEKELNEEVTKMLKADDPQAPQNVIRFNVKDRAFKIDPQIEHTAVHFAFDGYMIHKETDEAKRQMAETEKQLEAAHVKEVLGQSEDAELADEGPGGKVLRNQFNFSERASQTFNNPMKDRWTATDPPPSVNFTGLCTQWEIFDSYIHDQEEKKEAKERVKAKQVAAEDGAEHTPKDSKETVVVDKPEKSTDPIHSAAMSKALKIVERMVNQNAYDDIAQDYKYWEDASDAYREGEGTLLPLWKFYNEKIKKKQVTSICWNTEYNDLFAVGYGSYDFMKQGSGLICCFSLKNPSHPEYMFTTESGVMCLDWHKQHSSLLAVGCYDGTVMVFDVRNKVNRPIFQSTVKTGKHTDPVWEVRWQDEDLSKNLNFFSISTDGRVTLWTMSKNELQHTDVMELKLVGMTREGGELAGEEDTSLSGLAGGMCFDFNKHSDHLFIVGTEEGKIHKCSKAYNSQYLETYEGHHMAVYSTRWNHYHPRVYLSCSADWTVKLWNHDSKIPIMSFDLNNSVNDVAWAPYSSTVFAAVTSDGKVHVFDINENKHEAMCEQKVVRKAKLTHVCFNPRDPIILVGDDRGCVTSLKLSPNLRKPTKPKEEEPPADGEGQTVKKKKNDPKKAAEVQKTPEQLELEKLEKVIT